VGPCCATLLSPESQGRCGGLFAPKRGGPQGLVPPSLWQNWGRNKNWGYFTKRGVGAQTKKGSVWRKNQRGGETRDIPLRKGGGGFAGQGGQKRSQGRHFPVGRQNQREPGGGRHQRTVRWEGTHGGSEGTVLGPQPKRPLGDWSSMGRSQRRRLCESHSISGGQKFFLPEKECGDLHHTQGYVWPQQVQRGSEGIAPGPFWEMVSTSRGRKSGSTFGEDTG